MGTSKTSGKSSKSSSPKSDGKTVKETRQKFQRLSVIVFSGDPLDLPETRHTGLYIEHLNEDGSIIGRNFLHVTGSAGIFQREESIERNPTGSELFTGSVHVATIVATGSSDRRLRNAIWATPVNNAEYDWNCQSWVGDALTSCVNAGLISTEQRDMAIDGMAELILQATDMA
ncbi:uncharacterized protein THITE_2124771 [Thermothielavioides terrestris NRRL 8126]|uniref:Uncharacterized protein n=1 Tax=Thermothielavioides terrestris (strain ATCC 38088 / NRRL 8126) TaxID=578455 RepID=G2RGK9_THETT|nr:uncharacterized protein THITE_2124771 [Thermothielavioides terrestris NRRL 8126]AEO71898.1 hypothetical protein THITE_2124771 [Thermothielavioides terrestris NRRL 8126]